MEPSAIHYEPVEASASPEVPMNQFMDNLEYGTVYALRHEAIDGLDIGTWGGRWGGFAVDEEEYTLTDDADNYLVVDRSDGVLSIATSTTNWNDTTNYARDYKITTLDGVITAIEDHRAGAGGVHGGSAGGGGSAGRHAIWVAAAAMRPSVTGGCAPLAVIATSANQPDIASLDFDTTTQEYAQFSVAMPKSWDEGTLTFKPVWSHPSTTTNFGVVFDLQAVATSNDDAIAAAFGTAQTSTDTGGTTDDLYIGPESSAITVGGSPAAEDVVHFRASRVTGNGSDTLAVDARLHGIILYITTDADNDA